MTASTWWTASARGTFWLPSVASPLMAIAMLLGSDLAGAQLFPDEYGHSLVAVSVAFVVDDPTARLANALPVTVRSRLLARAASVVPFTALGLGAVLLADRVTTGTVTLDATAMLTLAAASLTVAAVASHRDVPSPGAIGAGAAAAAGLAVGVVSPFTVTVAPGLLCALVVALACVVTWSATRDPRR